MTLKKMEINAITGEEVYTDLDTKETNEYNAWTLSEAKKVTDEAAALKEMELKKAAILTKLGITADEAKLLLS